MAPFEPHNDLERVMAEASRDESRYRDFLHALSGADVYIPQPHIDPADSSGETRMSGGDEITLPLVEHEGKTYVPVFTSLEQFRLGVPEQTAFVRLPTNALFEGWPEEHGMAINPGGEMGVALEASDIKAAAAPADVAGPSLQRLAAGTNVMLGEPAEEPIELLESARRACRAHGGVRAAYRALMAVEGEEEKPQTVIGVELDEGVESEEFFNDLGPRLRPVSSGPFSFILVDEKKLSSVARFMLLETDPFYRRDDE